MKSVTIKGGGLSGCLLLAALKYRWPDLKVTLCERSSHLSKHQTWSFHNGDVPEHAWTWLTPLISKQWSGYNVFFPTFTRSFNTGYSSIRALDLATKIQTLYSKNIQLNCSDSNDPDALITTGWTPLNSTHEYGYQKFVGLDLKLQSPHGLTKPILKDVRCEQTDGYRFFYVLPFSETELLIEDTYYSNSPTLNIDHIKNQILHYAKLQQWSVEKIIRQESGSLPLDLQPPSVQLSGLEFGAAAGLAHPVTGYSFPAVIRQIQALLDSEIPDIAVWRQRLATENKKISAPVPYYCFLNRMMFKAAIESKRYQILERFYTLSQPLIERFYAGKTNNWDKIRILLGKPPVPISRALKQLRSPS